MFEVGTSSAHSKKPHWSSLGLEQVQNCRPLLGPSFCTVRLSDMATSRMIVQQTCHSTHEMYICSSTVPPQHHMGISQWLKNEKWKPTTTFLIIVPKHQRVSPDISCMLPEIPSHSLNFRNIPHIYTVSSLNSGWWDSPCHPAIGLRLSSETKCRNHSMSEVRLYDYLVT